MRSTDTHTHARCDARARAAETDFTVKRARNSSSAPMRPNGSALSPLIAAATELIAAATELRPHLFDLLHYLGLPAAWLVQFLRLVLFVILLLPYFLRPTLLYALSSNIQHGVRYGSSVRCAVDVYLPLDAQGKVLTGARRPVVVFVSGGAWIIGFRMWGFLLGLALQRRGVVCVSVDYRNFPQARMDAMVDDVSAACDWVEAHAESLGGDPCNISVVGQSAGAHLTALMLLRRVGGEGSEDTAATTATAGFVPAQWVGISGPYDIRALAPSLRRRGLSPSLIDALASDDLDAHSPTSLLVRRACGRDRERGRAMAGALHTPLLRWPPTALFHGTEDKTVCCTQSTGLARQLRANGAPSVVEHYFEGKTHTDPILEDPLSSGTDVDDPLLEQVLRIVAPPADSSKGASSMANMLDGETCHQIPAESSPQRVFVPPRRRPRQILVRLARWVNPF